MQRSGLFRSCLVTYLRRPSSTRRRPSFFAALERSCRPLEGHSNARTNRYELRSASALYSKVVVRDPRLEAVGRPLLVLDAEVLRHGAAVRAATTRRRRRRRGDGVAERPWGGCPWLRGGVRGDGCVAAVPATPGVARRGGCGGGWRFWCVKLRVFEVSCLAARLGPCQFDVSPLVAGMWFGSYSWRRTKSFKKKLTGLQGRLGRRPDGRTPQRW